MELGSRTGETSERVRLLALAIAAFVLLVAATTAAVNHEVPSAVEAGAGSGSDTTTADGAGPSGSGGVVGGAPGATIAGSGGPDVGSSGPGTTGPGSSGGGATSVPGTSGSPTTGAGSAGAGSGGAGSGGAGSGGGGAPSTAPPATAPPTTVATVARSIDLGGRSTPVAVPAEVPPGHYLLAADVASPGVRLRLTVDGARVGEFSVREGRTTAVPVHLASPATTVGVERIDDGPDDAVRIGALHLTPSTPAFTTRGADVVDLTGRVVVQHGVNRTGLNQAADPPRMDATDFAAMRAAGVEIVRLKLGQHLWIEGFCDHDPSYRGAVDRAVRGITDLGMVAMLDLAWTTAGDPCGEPGLQKMPDNHSIRFWREVAGRYGGNPLVAFNIFNEPFGVTRAEWRNGTVFTQQTGIFEANRDWEAVGMQKLYDVVRETGATNIIYVSGMDYAHDLRPALTHPLDGYGIVYGAHAYCDGCTDLPPVLARGVDPVIGVFPVSITEFGTTLASPTFNERVIAWAAERNVGWQAFMWADRLYGAFGLLETWDAYDPSPGGRPVLAALAR